MNIRGEKRYLCRKNGVKVAQIQSVWKLESSQNTVRWILEHFPQELSCLHLPGDVAPAGSALALENSEWFGSGLLKRRLPYTGQGKRIKVVHFLHIPCILPFQDYSSPQAPQITHGRDELSS